MSNKHPRDTGKSTRNGVEEDLLLYRALVDNMNDGFGVVDENNLFTYVNRRFGELLGYSPNEMLGKRLEDFLDEKNAEILRENVQKRTEGKSSQYELEWSSKTGELVPTIVSGAPLIGEDGKHKGSFAVITDISERREAEEAIRESEERFRTLFQETPMGILTCDIDGKITRVNKIAVEMLGSPNTEETLEINLLSFTPLVNAGVSSDLRRCIDECVTIRAERPYTTRWNREMFLRYGMHPMIDELGNVVSVLCAFDDISETKKAMQDKIESEKKYRTLADQSLQGLTVIQDERYVYVNRAFGDIVGYSVDEIMEMSPEKQWALVHPEDQPYLLKLAEDREIGKQVPMPYKYRFIRKDGSDRWVEAFSSIIEYGGKPALQVLIIDVTDRHLAQEALLISERKYSQLFHQSNDGIIMHDLEGVIIDVNERALDLFGFTKDEILSMTIAELHPPKSLEKSKWAFETIKKEGTVNFEIDFRKKNGELFPAEVSSSLFEMAGKKYVQGEIRDIASRKAAESQLRASQQMLRLVMNNIPHYIFWKDRNSAYVGCNQSFARLAGVAIPENIAGKTDFDLAWTIEDANSFKEADRRVMDSDRPEYHIIVPLFQTDGSKAWLDTSRIPLHDDDGNVIGVLGTFEDVTDRKLHEEMIQKSERQYRALAEQSLQGLTILSDDGLEYVNKAFAEMVGYSVDELLDMSIDETWALFHPADIDELKKRIEARMGKKPLPPRYEYRLLHRDGHILWVETFASTIEYAGKRAIQTVLVDVTERRKAEREVRTAKDRAILYLDLMGHDLRNQMQVILNSADLLRLATDEAVQDSFQEILHNAVARCSRLIEEVRSTEQLLVKPLIERSLDDALKGVISAMSSRVEDTTFDTLFEVKKAKITADEFLELLLSNILINAVEHNPGKEKRVWISVKEQNDGYIVSIADNGPGISDQRKAELFDMARRFGGVGLHQSSQIVEKYGGRIEVHDRVPGSPEEGAEFQIWLPKAVKAAK